MDGSRQGDIAGSATLDELYPKLAAIAMGAGWNKKTPSLWPTPGAIFRPFQWRYAEAKGALDAAGRLIDTSLAERRNLILANPIEGNDYATASTTVVAYQMIMPGEQARSHRHTPNALRLVLDAEEGAFTVVDGTRLPMLPGDVLLTPNWSWHGHGNDSAAPAYWLDFLDVPVVHLLNPMFFEPYPGDFEVGNQLTGPSPLLFRWQDTARRLDEAAGGRNGALAVEVKLGDPALDTLALSMIRLTAGGETASKRTTANNVYACVEGEGETIVGDERFSWRRGDVVVAPAWAPHSHRASDGAVLFRVTDEPIMTKLGFFRADREGDMADVKLDFACGLYDRTLPLYTGAVKPEGIALNYIHLDDPRQIFDRLAGGREFDAAEFSSSEFVSRLCAGDREFVAIPAFPSRVFRHGFVTINRRKGIRTPKDLEGKRIGVPLYTMTAAIFIRGMLQHQYGVDLGGVRWVQGAINSAGAHGNPSAPAMLRPVAIENNQTGRSLSDLLAAGEIDAIIGANLPDSMKTSPDVVRLFPDYREVEKAYYRETRIFPVMHLVAIRRRFYEANPEAVVRFYQALCRSKDAALGTMRNLATLRYMLPWMSADLDEIDDVFGGDPWPYGVAANRPTLTALVTYLAEQGLIAASPSLEDVFVDVAER